MALVAGERETGRESLAPRSRWSGRSRVRVFRLQESSLNGVRPVAVCPQDILQELAYRIGEGSRRQWATFDADTVVRLGPLAATVNECAGLVSYRCAVDQEAVTLFSTCEPTIELRIERLTSAQYPCLQGWLN